MKPKLSLPTFHLWYELIDYLRKYGNYGWTLGLSTFVDEVFDGYDKANGRPAINNAVIELLHKGLIYKFQNTWLLTDYGVSIMRK